MIASQHLLPFLLTCLVIIPAPGPSVLFTIARAVAWGRKVAFLTVLGNAIGMLLLAGVVAGGLGPLIQQSKLVYALIQWLGGLYLAWMGVDAIRHRVVAANEMANMGADAPSSLATLRQGFIVGVLNPKVVVFFAAILPHYVDPELGSVWLQLFTLGAIFCALAVVSDGTYGVLAGTAREWLSANPQRLVALRVIGGGVMIALGASITFTAPLPW